MWSEEPSSKVEVKVWHWLAGWLAAAAAATAVLVKTVTTTSVVSTCKLTVAVIVHYAAHRHGNRQEWR